jgi:1,5-anhydro-D-fructose reductase (1,5-anhydro-D-mannitol-forming)
MEHGIAVIGCGAMGGVWRDASMRRQERVGDSRLLYTCDENLEAAQSRAEGTPARATDDIDTILADDAVSALVVCTPTFTHPDLVVAAAQAGKHVLVEKPMALTLGACRRMIDACSQAGVKLAVGQTLRFWGAFLRSRQLVAEGAIGAPWFGQAHRMSAASPTAADHVDPPLDQLRWRYDTRYSGGNILEGVVHELDFTRAVFGDVTAVTCTASGKVEADGLRSPIVLQAVLEFDRRRLATVRMGGLVGYGGGGSWISGTEGTLCFDDWSGPVTIHRHDEPKPGVVSCDDLLGDGAAYDRELADLLDAVGDDGEPENSGRNGMCNIGLGLAMYRAIESGERFAFEAGLPVAVDDDYQYRGPNTVL